MPELFEQRTAIEIFFDIKSDINGVKIKAQSSLKINPTLAELGTAQPQLVLVFSHANMPFLYLPKEIYFHFDLFE